MLSYTFPWPVATEVVASSPRTVEQQSAEIVYLKPATEVGVIAEVVTTQEPDFAAEVSNLDVMDWGGVLDNINNLGRLAKQQDARLLEQKNIQNKKIAQLEQNLVLAEQKLKAAEERLTDSKALAEARILDVEKRAAQRIGTLEERYHGSEKRENELSAQLRRLQEQLQVSERKQLEAHQDADKRIESIQIQGKAQMRLAEERAKAAELKAETTVRWLKRIEHAAKSLSNTTASFQSRMDDYAATHLCKSLESHPKLPKS